MMRQADFRRIDSASNLPAELRGGVVAIGNFDGVHRGHQAVLERALAEARRLGAPALALTFEPHPRQFFRPDQPLFRLTPAPVKARLLCALGFDAVVEQPFTEKFSHSSPDTFIDGVLVGALGVRHVVTGFNFHFGENRRGDPAFMKAAGQTRGFGVSHVEALCDEGGQVVSSSRIRALLAEADVGEAAGLLGYRYFVEAEVIGGKRLGRMLGYPTANMALPASNGLRHGIYAVRLVRADGSIHDAVASFGRRPTVDEAGEPLLETHVFDFDGDLYGETCRVSFFGFLRGEEKFEGLDALTAQMKHDEAEARALLTGVRALGELDAAMSY